MLLKHVSAYCTGLVVAIALAFIVSLFSAVPAGQVKLAFVPVQLAVYVLLIMKWEVKNESC